MSSLEEQAEALAHSAYWDERYAKSDGKHPIHEWFKSYGDLQPFLFRHLFRPRPPDSAPRILHLGAGDSTIPHDLLERGYRNQVCVDFSAVVVELMAAREPNGVEWIRADVRDMPVIPDRSVDVAFDKGTLDAMIHGSPWDPPDDVNENSARYMKEVFRVLKNEGVFLYITFRQPHFVKPLVNQDRLWDLTLEILRENESSFNYHAFIMKKAHNTRNDGPI